VKRPFAVVALFALTWSNTTALQCFVATPPPSPDMAAHVAAHVATGHAGHTAPPEEAANEHAGAHEGSHDADHGGRTDCGILMACGAALGTQTATEPTRTEGVERIAVAPASRPSTADRTQDPPPPRRTA
jgi:hypothetical protein